MGGAKKAPRQTYTERQKFIVYVLWLHGLTEREAGLLAGLRRKQVSGIIARSDYRNRSALTLDERATFLRQLAEIRYDESGRAIDDNVLPPNVFFPKP